MNMTAKQGGRGVVAQSGSAFKRLARMADLSKLVIKLAVPGAMALEGLPTYDIPDQMVKGIKSRPLVRDEVDVLVDVQHLLERAKVHGFVTVKFSRKPHDTDKSRVIVRMSLKRTRERGHIEIGDVAAWADSLRHCVGILHVFLNEHQDVGKSVNIDLRDGKSMNGRARKQVRIGEEWIVLADE